MINKFEAVGIFVCIGFMAMALFLLRMDGAGGALSALDSDTQAASVVVVDDSNKQGLANSLVQSMSTSGELNNMIIDDIVIGEGKEVVTGDEVSVHYIGTLQSGEQFDNSYVKGTPFEFKVGDGKVIKGWDQGLIGMKVGGQRILVIPSDLAYGKNAVGPIPANATLVFSIELLEIK